MALMDNYDLYLRLLADINSNQAGHVKPYGNFIKWLSEINLELFKEKFGQDYEKNQVTMDSLTLTFLKTGNVTLVPQAGQPYDVAAFPVDYGYFSSGRIMIRNVNGKPIGCPCADTDVKTYDGKTGKEVVDPLPIAEKSSHYKDPDTLALEQRKQESEIEEYPVTKVTNNKWASAITHEFLGPTLDQPIMTQYSGGFKVAPKGVGILILDYLKNPTTPTFVYTLDGNDQIVYNASASIQLQWPETMMGEFIKRLAKRFAKYVKDDATYGMSEQERQISKE